MAKGKKTGGRQKGTPNKENPLKGYLRAHSMAYFAPRPQTDPITGNALTISDFEADMIAMDPDQRVNAELRLLEFHTPKMKAVEVDMDISGTVVTIEDRLRELCGEPEDPDDTI